MKGLIFRKGLFERLLIGTIILTSIITKKLYSAKLHSNLINKLSNSIETFKELAEQIDEITPYIHSRWSTSELMKISNETYLQKISTHFKEYNDIREIIPK